MHKRVSRYIVALIGVLVFLLTGQPGVQGYVWCLGEDGHAALEYAENNTCGPEAVAQEQGCHVDEGLAHDEPGHEEFGSEDNCGPCLDIPATLEVASSKSQDHKDFHAPVGFPVPEHTLVAAVRAADLPIELLAQPPPRVSQSLRAHRTVVLLN